MADDPRTGKEEGEEEEGLEGKGTDSTVDNFPSQKASQTVSDSDQNDPPDSAQNVSQNVSQSGSEYKRSESPSLRNTPSKSDGISMASQTSRQPPSRSGIPSVQTESVRPSTASQASRPTMSVSPGASPRKSPSKSLRTNSESESPKKTRMGSAATPRTEASSRSTRLNEESRDGTSETEREYGLQGQNVEKFAISMSQPQSTSNIMENSVVSRKPTAKAPRSKDKNVKGRARDRQFGVGVSRLLERRSPFVHNPPYPEERRARISHPQCPKDYIINLREDLADFQEAHGLPRTRDYSFMSLGLALAQETGRAIYSVFLMVAELFPVIAIVSLILRFALDKVIEILETDGAVPRIKKTLLFALQLIIIIIPLWVFVATIIVPIFCLILSIFRRLFHLSGRKSAKTKATGRAIQAAPKKKKMCLF